jgi:hypothetical protein
MKKKIRIKKTEFFVVAPNCLFNSEQEAFESVKNDLIENELCKLIRKDNDADTIRTIRTEFDKIKEIMETEYEIERG